MIRIMRAVRNAVATSVTTVVGGIFSKFRNLVAVFRNNPDERHRVTRRSRITKWEQRAEYSGWVKAKCYEDSGKNIFYLFAYNKNNVNTLNVAVVQGKAVGARPEMHVYTKDSMTGDIKVRKYPSAYDVRDLKEIFV